MTEGEKRPGGNPERAPPGQGRRMNELTNIIDTCRRETFKKIKGAAWRGGGSDGPKGSDSPLKIEAPRNVQKKLKNLLTI
jgi:hypothetical protein